MGKEVERRFLVQSDDWRQKADSEVHYRQGYLSTDPKRSVRIRTSTNEARLTIKGPAKGNARSEFEYSVPLEDAKKIEKLCIKPLLEKTRHKILQNGFIWEVDEYSAENDGLIVAEVETKGNGRIAKLPRWLGPEISGDRRYQNIALVEHPFTTWKNAEPKPDTKYYFEIGKEISGEIRRVLMEQLNAAIDELSHWRERPDAAVHEARKCIKRTRSLLRMIRPVVADLYEIENRRLQRVGRNLSELRDAEVLIETLQHLESSQDFKAKNKVANAYRFLHRRKKKTVTKFRRVDGFSSAIRQLRGSCSRIEARKFAGFPTSAIIDSLTTSLRQGERAFGEGASNATPATFHECRKRVKDLRYQLELLTKLWPEVIEGYADSAKELEQSLGDDHNLAMLADILGEGPGNIRIEGLASLICKRQAKLRHSARIASDRLYSESPKSWRHRLHAAWKASTH